MFEVPGAVVVAAAGAPTDWATTWAVVGTVWAPGAVVAAVVAVVAAAGGGGVGDELLNRRWRFKLKLMSSSRTPWRQSSDFMWSIIRLDGTVPRDREIVRFN